MYPTSRRADPYGLLKELDELSMGEYEESFVIRWVYVEATWIKPNGQRMVLETTKVVPKTYKAALSLKREIRDKWYPKIDGKGIGKLEVKGFSHDGKRWIPLFRGY
jgi:hypothetical protein